MTSKISIVRSSIACDRCGATHPQAESDLAKSFPQGWGHVQAHASDPHRIVPDIRDDGERMVARDGVFARADMCPACTNAFFDWWNAGLRNGGAA